MILIVICFCKCSYENTENLAIKEIPEQNKIMIEQPYKGLALYPYANAIEIDSLSQIPAKHQFFVNKIINYSMYDFQDNITFVKGQIIDIENWLLNDSIKQAGFLFQFVLPKYELYFELSDTTIGIKKYCFKIGLDPYGQITYFDWPKENYDRRENFINPEAILTLAVKTAKNKGYKTSSYISSLWHDWRLDKLCWEILFLQNSSNEYRKIVIDAIKLEVLEEIDVMRMNT